MTEATRKSRRKNKNLKWMVGLGVIFLVIIGISLSNSTATPYTFSPRRGKRKSTKPGGQTVKVGGMVKPGSVVWEPKESLKFTLSNLKDTEIQVVILELHRHV